MTRVFGRGELKRALLQVAVELGPSNGYAIMHALAVRVGGSWQPSPGAIYPALLALEDAGLLAGEDDGGGRRYAVTDAGRLSVAAEPDVLDQVAGRVREAPAPPVTAGAVLDRLAAGAPHRDRHLDAAQAARLESLFRPLIDELTTPTAKEAP